MNIMLSEFLARLLEDARQFEEFVLANPDLYQPDIAMGLGDWYEQFHFVRRMEGIQMTTETFEEIVLRAAKLAEYYPERRSDTPSPAFIDFATRLRDALIPDVCQADWATEDGRSNNKNGWNACRQAMIEGRK